MKEKEWFEIQIEDNPPNGGYVYLEKELLKILNKHHAESCVNISEGGWRWKTFIIYGIKNPPK